MARDRDRDIPWGGFLLLAAVIAVALSIFFLREIERMTQGSYVVLAAFPEGGGVRPGAPVWVAGRETGEVLRVEMLPATQDLTGGIVVAAEFPGSMREILRSGSRVRMTSGSPTTGDVVEFLPGAGAELTPQDTVWGFEPVDRTEALVAGLGALAREMEVLFDTVEAVADAGEARLERLDELGTHAERVSDLMEEFTESAQRSASGRGRLLADLDRLTGAVARFGSVLAAARASLRGPEGLRAEDRALRERLPATLSDLRERLAALRSGLADPNGSLARLQTDSALWRAIDAARAEADSLVAELSGDPGRMF